jgi:uncharacterized SAM-binding protein YcdF (DUF218 family)
MRQFASELVTLLLSPANWILLLLILQFVLKSPGARKKCRWSALAVFLLFSNQWLLNGYARLWQPGPRDISTDSPYSCAIVLGGFGNGYDNGNKGYFNLSADRFLQAVKLYKEGKVHHLLISGGNGKREYGRFNEGEWAREELKAIGIPPEAVLVEDQSANTADNAVNSKRLIDSAGFSPPFLLITSAHHMPRASLLFKQAGLNTVAYPCNYMAGYTPFGFKSLLPDAANLAGWNPYLKETAGYLFYKLRGK